MPAALKGGSAATPCVFRVPFCRNNMKVMQNQLSTAWDLEMVTEQGVLRAPIKSSTAHRGALWARIKSSTAHRAAVRAAIKSSTATATLQVNGNGGHSGSAAPGLAQDDSQPVDGRAAPPHSNKNPYFIIFHDPPAGAVARRGSWVPCPSRQRAPRGRPPGAH